MNDAISTPDFAIDRSNGISAWKQIADSIGRAIRSGAFDDTGRVPPETVLAERYGVNRHTVRSALASLAEEGLLSRVQGRGTMIEKRDRLVFPISRRTRFSEGLGLQAGAIARQVIRAQVCAASPEIAEALHLQEAETLVCVLMLGLVDAQPVSLATAYFPHDRFAGMAAEIARLQSVTRAFSEHGVADYTRVWTDVTGRTASLEETTHLRLSAGAVVLEAASVNADLQGVPVQFSRSVFSADKIALRFDTP